MTPGVLSGSIGASGSEKRRNWDLPCFGRLSLGRNKVGDNEVGYDAKCNVERVDIKCDYTREASTEPQPRHQTTARKRATKRDELVSHIKAVVATSGCISLHHSNVKKNNSYRAPPYTMVFPARSFLHPPRHPAFRHPYSPRPFPTNASAARTSRGARPTEHAGLNSRQA